MELAPALTSFHHIINLMYSEPRRNYNSWHIQNPGIFKSSTVFTSLSNTL